LAKWQVIDSHKWGLWLYACMLSPFYNADIFENASIEQLVSINACNRVSNALSFLGDLSFTLSTFSHFHLNRSFSSIIKLSLKSTTLFFLMSSLISSCFLFTYFVTCYSFSCSMMLCNVNVFVKKS
jgi:hypothetical protein